MQRVLPWPRGWQDSVTGLQEVMDQVHRPTCVGSGEEAEGSSALPPGSAEGDASAWPPGGFPSPHCGWLLIVLSDLC